MTTARRSRNRIPVATEREAYRAAHPDWTPHEPPLREPIAVTCPKGHEFETMSSPGMRVRCPECRAAGGSALIPVPLPDGSPVPGGYGKKARAKLKAARRAEREAAEAAEREAAAAFGREIRDALGQRAVRPGPAPRVTRARVVAPGVTAITCSQCGLDVWRARLADEIAERLGYRTPWVMLEPRHAPGERSGNISVRADGRAVFTRGYPGDYAKHNCPAKVSACKYCREPVRVLTQPPGSPEYLAVVDADEDPDSVVVVDARGYAVRDPEFAIEGARYRWHAKHGGAA